MDRPFAGQVLTLFPPNMLELYDLLTPLTHLKGFRFINHELVYQSANAEHLFWVAVEDSQFSLYVNSERQFSHPDAYQIAQYLKTHWSPVSIPSEQCDSAI